MKTSILPLSILKRMWTSIRRWFDTAAEHDESLVDEDKIDLLRAIPFALLHLMCLGVIWTGWSWTALGIAAGLYVLRMFAITGFYHRYFSHRTFRTSRPVQFAFACLANAACQRGPLWWASHHRQHHRHSDEPCDVHSPRHHGFWWSHVGWFLTPANFRTESRYVKDLAAYPELRLLDRFDVLVPALLFAGLYALGEGLAVWAPGLGTDGWQLLVWGGGISTVLVFHATCSINSLAHKLGRRRYETGDDSRNSFLLAMITLGEGWHNNHHHYAVCCRQGFYWWEIDPTYYILRGLQAIGVVDGVRELPAKAREKA